MCHLVLVVRFCQLDRVVDIVLDMQGFAGPRGFPGMDVSAMGFVDVPKEVKAGSKSTTGDVFGEILAAYFELLGRLVEDLVWRPVC